MAAPFKSLQDVEHETMGRGFWYHRSLFFGLFSIVSCDGELSGHFDPPEYHLVLTSRLKIQDEGDVL